MCACSCSFLAATCKISRFVCLLVGCLTSQQHASVSQGRICSDNFTCCHTEIEVADQTFHLTQSQYTDTGPTSPSADPITPGAWVSDQNGVSLLYIMLVVHHSCQEPSIYFRDGSARTICTFYQTETATEDQTWFESRLRRDFFWVESYQ